MDDRRCIFCGAAYLDAGGGEGEWVMTLTDLEQVTCEVHELIDGTT